MKTHLIASLLLSFASLALAQSDIIPLSKKRSDDTLLDGFNTGAKTIKISATGTLEWVNGATLTGASAFRTAAGLAIGTNVQAYDADLTTWAGITPSANVQTLLDSADYAAMRTALGLVIGTNVQAYDADLTTWAGITPSSNVQSLVGAPNYASMRALLGLVIGTNVQAYDADLTTWAGITPSANVQTLLGSADYAAFRTSLGLVIGTNVQAYDADLTTWAGITPGTGVGSALGNAVDAASGLLTYGMIGTSGAKLPLLNAANTFSAAQTISATVTLGGGQFTMLNIVGPYNTIAISQVGDGAMWLSGNSLILPVNGYIRFGYTGGTDPILTASASNLTLTQARWVAAGGQQVGSNGTPHSKIKSGVATLTAGTVTVSDSDVLETGTAATSSRIFVTRMNDGGTLGAGYTITRVNATSFTITSSSASENSTVSWMMVNP